MIQKTATQCIPQESSRQPIYEKNKGRKRWRGNRQHPGGTHHSLQLSAQSTRTEKIIHGSESFSQHFLQIWSRIHSLSLERLTKSYKNPVGALFVHGQPFRQAPSNVGSIAQYFFIHIVSRPLVGRIQIYTIANRCKNRNSSNNP